MTVTEIFENGCSFYKALANPLSLTQMTTKAGEGLKSISDTQSSSHSSLETDSSFEISLGCLEKRELQKSLYHVTDYFCQLLSVFGPGVTSIHTGTNMHVHNNSKPLRRANNKCYILLIYNFHILLMNRKYIQPKKKKKKCVGFNATNAGKSLNNNNNQKLYRLDKSIHVIADWFSCTNK